MGNKKTKHLGILGGILLLWVFLFPPFKIALAHSDISILGTLIGGGILLLSLLNYVDLPWVNASFGFYNPLIFCYVLFWGKSAVWPVVLGFLAFFLIKGNGAYTLVANLGRYAFTTAATGLFYLALGGTLSFSALSAEQVIVVAAIALIHLSLDFVLLAFHFYYIREFPGFKAMGTGYIFEPPIYFLTVFVPMAYHFLSPPAFAIIPLFFLATLVVFKLGIKAYVERESLQTLYDFAKRLSSTLNAGAFLPEICSSLLERMKARGCAVYLRSEDRLQRKGGAGVFAAEGSPETLKEILLEKDVKIFSRPFEGIPESFFPLAVAALKNREKNLGVLLVSGPFTSYEQEKFLSILAGQISSAINNSYLFEEALRANENLKAVQAQLIQASKLAAVGQLAAGIAHEINNPLGAILLNVSQLMKRPDDKEAVEIVLEASKRCQGIVERLLHFSRQASGGKKPFPLADGVKSALRLWEKQLAMDGIVVETSFTSIQEVNGEAEALSQVVANLISNARDAIQSKKNPGGKIKLLIYDTGSQVHFEISDNGCGIPGHVLPKIFDPFFTTKDVGKGTGLGLSVSYGIIKGMNGEIQTETKSGEGTTFKLIFPAVSPGEDAHKEKSPVEQALKLL